MNSCEFERRSVDEAASTNSLRGSHWVRMKLVPVRRAWKLIKWSLWWHQPRNSMNRRLNCAWEVTDLVLFNVPVQTTLPRIRDHSASTTSTVIHAVERPPSPRRLSRFIKTQVIRHWRRRIDTEPSVERVLPSTSAKTVRISTIERKPPLNRKRRTDRSKGPVPRCITIHTNACRGRYVNGETSHVASNGWS